MNLQIQTTKGVTCKACDQSLDGTNSDGELCSTCLGVVHELNKVIYENIDHEEEEGNEMYETCLEEGENDG